MTMYDVVVVDFDDDGDDDDDNKDDNAGVGRR
jgi:hypothetical protein